MNRRPGVPERDMHFSGEPTSDGDTAAEYLRTFYEANCPELHLGGWRDALSRWIRRVFFGFNDYDVDRDRDRFMGQLIDEVKRIETERLRQVFPHTLGASGAEAPVFNTGGAGSNPDEGTKAPTDFKVLVAEAEARYQALSPEQKAEHDRAQRESFVRGQTGWPAPKYKWVDGVKIYDSMEDYMND